MPERNQVYHAIDTERSYQEQKWGRNHDEGHDVPAWLCFIQHHLNLAIAAASTSKDQTEALHQVRKIAALAVSCMEVLGAPVRQLNVPVNQCDIQRSKDCPAPAKLNPLLREAEDMLRDSSFCDHSFFENVVFHIKELMQLRHEVKQLWQERSGVEAWQRLYTKLSNEHKQLKTWYDEALKKHGDLKTKLEDLSR